MHVKWISFLLLTAASLLALTAHAQDTASFKDIGDHRIYFSVFNSHFLPPEAASGYGFVRAKDRGIINIAVTHKDAGGLSRGLPVRLKGSAANLLQQVTDLTFVEVDEGDAVYYLAEFTFPDREVLNFTIHILRPEERYSDTIEFAKTLYHD